MMSLAGRPIHRNGTAAVSGANATRVDFGAQVKHVLIKNTSGSITLNVSFDNYQTVWAIAPASTSQSGELSGHWFIDHVHLRGAHTATTVDYEIIATQMT